MVQVRLTAAAKADLVDAVAWYRLHAPSIAPRFRQSLRDVVARIEHNARQFPSSSRNTRQALMRQFPYVVIFRETDEACFVVAIFHTRRDPRKWERRIP